MHSEAKQAEIVEFGAEKLVLVKKAPALKMRDLDSSQIHPAGWPGCRGFKSKSKGGRVGVLCDFSSPIRPQLQTSEYHLITCICH